MADSQTTIDTNSDEWPQWLSEDDVFLVLQRLGGRASTRSIREAYALATGRAERVDLIRGCLKRLVKSDLVTAQKRTQTELIWEIANHGR